MISRAAEELRLAEMTREPLARLSSRYLKITLLDAYEIQRRNIRRRQRDGAVMVGHKVGLTSLAMQRQMGVNEPDSGVLLDEMMIEDGATLAVDRLIVPRIEAEIAFWLGADIAGPEVGVDEAEAAVSGVCLALEVIDSRFRDWQIQLVDSVADNASSAHAVTGPSLPFTPGLNLTHEQVTLRVNGATAAAGKGSAVLGNPLEAVVWLARRLSARGESLHAGQLIMTGAVHASIALAGGDDVDVVSPSLPPVGLRAL